MVSGENDLAEEYLLFPSDMHGDEFLSQDGPHSTLNWRKKVRKTTDQARNQTDSVIDEIHCQSAELKSQSAAEEGVSGELDSKEDQTEVAYIVNEEIRDDSISQHEEAQKELVEDSAPIP